MGLYGVLACSAMSTPKKETMNDTLSMIMTIADQLSTMRSPDAAAVGRVAHLSFKADGAPNEYYRYYQATEGQAPFVTGELRLPQSENRSKPTILILQVQGGPLVTARQTQQRMNAYPTAIPPSPTGPVDTYQHVYQYKEVKLSFEFSSDKDELKTVTLSVVQNN